MFHAAWTLRILTTILLPVYPSTLLAASGFCQVDVLETGQGSCHQAMGSFFGLHCLPPPYLHHGRPHDSSINFWATGTITCEMRETQTEKKKTNQHQTARWGAGLLVKNTGSNDLFLPMSIGPKSLLFRLKFVLPYFWTEQRDMLKSVLRRLVIILE